MRGARANRYAAGRAALRTGRFIGRAAGTISYQAAVACCPMFVAASAILRPRALIGARATFAAATTSCIELRPNVAGARPTRRRTRRDSSISREGRHAHSHSNRNGTAKGLPPRFAVARPSAQEQTSHPSRERNPNQTRGHAGDAHHQRFKAFRAPAGCRSSAAGLRRVAARCRPPGAFNVLRDFARWPVSRRFRSRRGAGT